MFILRFNDRDLKTERCVYKLSVTEFRNDESLSL